MVKETKIKRTYSITKSVDRKLSELAKAGERDKSAQVRVLVNEAYRKLEKKQAQSSK